MTGESDPGPTESSRPFVSVEVRDLFGLGRGLDALIKALRAGIGPAFEPFVRSRIAKADQAAALGWIELTEKARVEPVAVDVHTVDGRAAVRLTAESVRRQENREAIARAAFAETQMLLGEDAPRKENVEFEPEWLDRYWRLAEDISSEDLQALWARVLIRQAMGTGTVSARTLHALSILTRQEAVELIRLAPFCCEVRGASSKAIILVAPGHGIAERRIRATLTSSEYASLGVFRALIEPLNETHFGSIGFFC
jgi:hypothetical protein